MDIHGLLNRIQAKGYVVDNQKLTADFLSGIFSLDGIHPTNTGYAIVGNEFIKELNREFKTDIRDIPLGEIKSGDPLVLQGGWSSGLPMRTTSAGKRCGNFAA